MHVTFASFDEKIAEQLQSAPMLARSPDPNVGKSRQGATLPRSGYCDWRSYDRRPPLWRRD